MTHEHDEDVDSSDPRSLLLQDEGFVPNMTPGSADYNTQRIHLDGTIKSNLDWSKAKEQALQAIDSKLAILWELDLGIGRQLSLPLSHAGQFHSLQLAVDHFYEAIWKEFEAHSIGVVFYSGSADFSHSFAWDDAQEKNWQEWQSDAKPGDDLAQLKRLYCRNAITDFLNLLASILPDHIPCYLFLDAAEFEQHPLYQLQLLNPDGLDRFQLGFKMPEQPSLGLCLPLWDRYSLSDWEGISQALEVLKSQNMPFRIIPESQIIMNWEGLDALVYTPAGLSPQGRRQIQGFCAAGGVAVSLGAMQGFTNEVCGLCSFITKKA